jgi:hypothetical protein
MDLKEYRVSHMQMRDQDGPMSKRKRELFVSKKSVYERALPLLVKESDPAVLEKNPRL